MLILQSLVSVVNEKVVYFFKFTNQKNIKMDVLTKDLKRVDVTFSYWQKQLTNFSNSVQCHESMTMEFLSKYSAEVNRAFTAFLRLFEIQDTLNQVSRLNDRTLVGLSKVCFLTFVF